MSWRDRDWARFTDAETEAIYGRSPRSAPPAWAPSPRRSRRPRLVPRAGLAVVVSIAVGLLAGQLPRGHPLVPRLHVDLPGLSRLVHREHPLDLPATATEGSILTLNGTDAGASSGEVVAVGRWNGGPPTTLASGALAYDHSWSLPISLNQQGTLALTIKLPGGNTLAGSVIVAP